jgi:hypothetical protein
MHKPRYSLKTLILSISLVAAGITSATSASTVLVNSGWMYFLVPGLWFGGGGIAGAGIGMLMPFKMPSIGATLGAMVGAVAQLIVLAFV